jgi:hypothetical protein
VELGERGVGEEDDRQLAAGERGGLRTEDSGLRTEDSGLRTGN